MRVELNKPFQKVSINIVFESQDEINSLYHRLNCPNEYIQDYDVVKDAAYEDNLNYELFRLLSELYTNDDIGSNRSTNGITKETTEEE